MTPALQQPETMSFSKDSWNQFMFNVGQLEMKVVTSEMLSLHVKALMASQVQVAPEPPSE
jgi:hypothetical protein